MEHKNTAPVVRVHRPDLTAEERAKQMERIKQAAADVIRATQRKHI